MRLRASGWILFLWAGCGLAGADIVDVTLTMSGVGQFVGLVRPGIGAFGLDGTVAIPELGFTGFFGNLDDVPVPPNGSAPFFGPIDFLSGPSNNNLYAALSVPAGVVDPALGTFSSFNGDLFIRGGSGEFAGATGQLSLTLDSFIPAGRRASFTMSATGELNLPARVPEPGTRALIPALLLLVAAGRLLPSRRGRNPSRPT